MTGPGTACAVDGCREPAVNTPRGANADDVVDAPASELAPLCARHAAEADEPESPWPAA